MSTPNQKYVFFNIGWMRDYCGLVNGDEILNGGGYVKDNGTGHEMFNFRPFKRKNYGFVRPLGLIDLQRIGGGDGADKIEDVLVIWTATSPHGGTRVIGWSQGATVYSEYQQPPPGSKRKYDGDPIGYYAVAEEPDCKLLPPSNRAIRVPRGKGAMGQSNVWYGDNVTGRKLLKRVQKLIATGTIPASTGKKAPPKSPKQADAKLRRKIEKAAVDLVTAHYKVLGYIVVSVETEARGWDLSGYGDDELQIEVKGLQGVMGAVELTPNEYGQMLKNKKTYRVCVVERALQKPRLRIFSHTPAHGWTDDDGHGIQIRDLVAARLSLT